MNDSTTGDFDDHGLYSNVIFGRQGEPSRDLEYSYINLRTKIFQPVYFNELARLKGLFKEIILGTSHAKWNAREKTFEKAGILDGRTGFSFFLEHFEEIKFKDGRSEERKRRIAFLEKWRSRALIDYMIIMPAGLRDVKRTDEDMPQEDDINPLYRSMMSMANVINKEIVKGNDPSIDGLRRSMQLKFVEIYEHVISLVSGKRGFAASKFASRKIFDSTRNVITAMEVGGSSLNDPRMPDVNATEVGVLQLAVAAGPLFIHTLRTGFLSSFIETIGQAPELIDVKTLTPAVDVDLKQKNIDAWATKEGIKALLNAFKEPTRQMKPAMLAGKYIKLIYQDKEKFIILNDITKLPEGLDKAKVRPLTWLELYYINLQDIVPRLRLVQTRYPVTGPGSIYPSHPYLRSTSKALQLEQYTTDNEPTGKVYLEYPDINSSTYSSMSVHPLNLAALGGDYDGDMLSMIALWSDEIKEIDDLLESKRFYLSSTGTLRLPLTTDTTGWVLNSLTGE